VRGHNTKLKSSRCS